MVYLKLFHGRKDPTEDMDDWGSEGPIFGPYNYIHTTYAHHIKMGRNLDRADELLTLDDLIYYDGMFYGDWSVFTDEVMKKEDPLVLEKYNRQKANSSDRRAGKKMAAEACSVKCVVYIKGGVCQDVRCNLVAESWAYAVVDYDNDPDLPDHHLPFPKEGMGVINIVQESNDLFNAAKKVIANWETPNLVEAVRDLALAITEIETDRT